MENQNNNMIDNMMGEFPQSNSIVGNLASSKRKGVNSFSDISNNMRWDARRLDQISKKYVPEAFPLSPPRGGSEPGYFHTPYEFLGAKFFTEIDDGLFAIDTVKEISRIGEAMQLILNSLFPNSFNTGTWEMEIPDQFEQAKRTINWGVETVIKKTLDELKEGLDTVESWTVNNVEMERFKNHLIRMAYDYVEDVKVPNELIDQNELAITPELIMRERAKLMKITGMPIDMSQVLFDSGSPRHDEDVDVIPTVTSNDHGNGHPTSVYEIALRGINDGESGNAQVFSDEIFKKLKTFGKYA